MGHIHSRSVLIIFLISILTGGLIFVGAQSDEPVKPDELRPKAQKLFNDGNWKEAQDMFKRLVLEGENNSGQPLVDDFYKAVQCLNNLGNLNEFDAFVESTGMLRTGAFFRLRRNLI